MRLFRILLVLAGAAVTALAQTNSPNVRELSLQDAIQLVLENNLDLQISRYAATIPLYTLQGDYGAYDPVFSFTGEHDHIEQGSQVVAGGLIANGASRDVNSFGGGSGGLLSGMLPSGGTYGLQFNASDTYGTQPGSIPTLNLPFASFTTNFVVTTNGIVPVVFANPARVPASFPFESSSAGASFNISQPLLKNFWIDMPRLTIRLDKNTIEHSEQQLRLDIMTTITKLEQAYYDLVYDRENVVVQQKALELAQRLVAENKKKVEVGTLAPLDEKQAESQAATSEATLIGAKSTLASQESVVRALVASRYSAWAYIIPVPTATLSAPLQLFDLQDSWDKALRNRPELLQARLDLERSGIQLKFDRNQMFPELDIFGTFGYSGFGTRVGDALSDLESRDRLNYSAGARLSIPLANIKARATYKADKAQMEENVLKVKKLERDIMGAIDTDIQKVRADYQQVGATKAAREYAEAALDAEQKKLESGKSTVYTVLQVQRDLTNARGNEIQALDNYNKDLSQLSLDEGTTMDRLRIRFEPVRTASTRHTDSQKHR